MRENREKTLSGLNAIVHSFIQNLCSQYVSLAMHNICRKPSHRTVWWLDKLIYDASHLTNTFSFTSRRNGKIYDRKCENYDVIADVNHDATSACFSSSFFWSIKCFTSLLVSFNIFTLLKWTELLSLSCRGSEVEISKLLFFSTSKQLVLMA